MTKNKKLKYAELSLLIMIWVVLLASPILFRKDEEVDLVNLSGPLQFIIPLFIIFLINRFVLVPYLLFKKKTIYYFVATGLMIAIVTTGIYFLDRPTDPVMHTRPPQERIDPEMPPPHAPNPPPGSDRGGPIPPFANFLIFSILLIGFDTGLRISFRLAEAERIKDKLEKDNVESQLAFLRNQVSPHFFMNTLNNIHSLIDIDTEEAKESIIRLSRLMRHLLYDSEIKKIPIQKEVDFIRNYIDLMKLRFSEKVKISFRVPEHLPDRSIPPLLFTSFVENAFKHGISYQNSSFIDITFSCTENRLTLEVRNSNPVIEKTEGPSGIGIENSRKRLDLIYGNKYSLDIVDENDEHYIRLSIPI